MGNSKTKEKEKTKKTTRRGNGEGSIFQRNDERWVAEIQVGVDTDGKQIIKTFYGKERKEVVAKLKQFQLTQIQGYDNLSKVTVKEYITNWLNISKKNSLKGTSLDRLESTINNYVIPQLGYYTMDKLTSPIIQDELINYMVDKELSYSSVKKAYNAINACCTYAVKNRQLMYNPVDTVEKPSSTKFKKSKIEIFSDEEIKRFKEACVLKYSNGKYIYKTGHGFIVMLYTGIRTSEALALKWSDINFETKKMHICKNAVMVKNRNKKKENDKAHVLKLQDSTKTIAGERNIDLSNQAIESLLELKNSEHYKEDGYIFCTADGDPIRPRNLRNAFDFILIKSDIKTTGMHTLRHTFASLLFRKGADIKTVSELLGHANVKTTSDTYIHLIPEQKKNVISLLDE